MKTIKIKFIDFYKGFDYKSSRIYEILNRNFDIEFAEQPDYIIYSVYGNEHLEYDCIRILWTGENMVPDFNVCDYAIGFEYMIFGDRYLRCPNYIVNLNYNSLIEIIQQDDARHKNNRKFCSFIYSNGGADKTRDELFYRLCRYKSVDSGGKHLNNTKMSKSQNRIEDKLRFESSYKFSIACENCSHSGYSTEKIVGAFAAGAIPIYWGDPEIKKIFNENAFINVMDYDSLDSLAEAVKQVDANDDLYQKYLESPVFKQPNYVKESKRNLEKFILHIFNQEHEECYRRSRVMWGKMYNDELRSMKHLCEHSIQWKIKKNTERIRQSAKVFRRRTVWKILHK